MYPLINKPYFSPPIFFNAGSHKNNIINEFLNELAKKEAEGTPHK